MSEKREPLEFRRTSWKLCEDEGLDFYLGDFKELRDPRHPGQEPLVDLQPVFTLASLHLEEFF